MAQVGSMFAEIDKTVTAIAERISGAQSAIEQLSEGSGRLAESSGQINAVSRKRCV